MKTQSASKLNGTIPQQLQTPTDLPRKGVDELAGALVEPQEMISELCSGNQALTQSMRGIHEICERVGDTATASMIENWVDQSERRTWFLFEITQKG